MAVSKRLRYEVLRRDNHACRYCGATAPDATLTVDHVTPVALGGSDDPGNLVAACRDCNAGKSSASADSALIADVSQDAVRWATAIKQATATAMAHRERIEAVCREVLDVFEDVQVPSYRGGGHASDYFPADWFRSVAQFLAAGLEMVELLDAAYITCGAYKVREDQMWRYFCGVCWSKVTERQEAAKALLTPPKVNPNASPQTAENSYATLMYANIMATCDNPRWWD